MRRRFRKPKSTSIPKNTKYVTKCAVGMFCDWQKTRSNKKAEYESTSFNFGDMKSLQDCDTNLEEMKADSLNFWMIKFVQEVAKKDEVVNLNSVKLVISCLITAHLVMLHLILNK